MMRYAKLVLSALCLVVTGWLGTAEAFVDAFLFIPGFQGESQEKGHPKWINLYQVSWGHSHVGAANVGSVMAAGRAQFQEVLVQKLFDSASPALATAVATGQLFPNAIIELMNAGSPAPFARLELTDVSITAYEANGAAGGQVPRPVESIKLNFSAIAWIYIPHDPKDPMMVNGPPIRGSWNLRTNKTF